MTKAEVFHSSLTSDMDVTGMVNAVKNAGGDYWGNLTSWKVDFDDGSWWSASIFYPENTEPYYNGSAKY